VIVVLAVVLTASSCVLAQPEDVAAVKAGDSVLTRARWSPYWVGAGIGVLSWLTFLLSAKAIGVSTAYARTAGMIGKPFAGSRVDKQPYFQKYAPKVDWEWMLVAGIVIGAFLSAILPGDFAWEMVPSAWRAQMGDTPVWRWFVALVGGIVMGIGARWAGGCTSGHGISGTLQLAVSSWLAAICFFVGGVATAMLIYHVLS
jgi:hypothetical protein